MPSNKQLSRTLECSQATGSAVPHNVKVKTAELHVGAPTVYGARFRQNFPLKDAIEFHAFAPLEALPCVMANDIHIGCSLPTSYCYPHKICPNRRLRSVQAVVVANTAQVMVQHSLPSCILPSACTILPFCSGRQQWNKPLCCLGNVITE
jgi:hypothetical protein